MYTYTDNSSAFLDPNGWEPRAETATRCEGRPDDQVLHIRGGPFVDWGGGLGRDLKCLNHSPELGAFKLAELGIEPEDYLNYTLTDAAVINSTCDTSADCRPGQSTCVLDGTTNRCLAPQCTSNDDCTVPGWYCPPPRRRSECCARRVPTLRDGSLVRRSTQLGHARDGHSLFCRIRRCVQTGQRRFRRSSLPAVPLAHRVGLSRARSRSHSGRESRSIAATKSSCSA